MKNLLDSLAALILKIGQVLLNTGVAFFLAQSLKPDDYGLFALATGLALVLSTLASLGIPTLLVREIPKYVTFKEWGFLHGVIRWAYSMVLGTSLLLSVALLLGSWLWQAHTKVLFWAALFVPFYTLLFLQQGILQGVGRPVLAQYPRSLIIDLLFIMLFLMFYRTDNVTLVLKLYLFSLSISAVISSLWVIKFYIHFPFQHQVQYNVKQWLYSALPMLFIGGSGLIHQQIPVLLTGFFVGREAAGVVDVVLRCSLLVSLPLMAANIVLAPKVAALFAQDRKQEIQSLLRFHVRWAFLLSLVLAMCLVVFRIDILQWLGRGFVQGASGLLIAILGQLVNVGSGSVIMLLNMTGLEQEALKGLLLGLGTTFISGLILIPQADIEGGVWAYVLGLVSLNLFLVYRVRKRLVLQPTVIG